MSQSRKMSLAESLLNVAIGYVIAIAAQIAVFPLFGIHVPLHDNLMIGALFTVVSIVRSYTLRRLFNFRRYKYTQVNLPTALSRSVVMDDLYKKNIIVKVAGGGGGGS